MEWVDYCKSFKPAVIQAYKTRTGKELHLDTPKTFTEKIQWLKLYDSNYLKTWCADKIAVHKFYKAILGRDIGIPILQQGILDWKSLPEKFVLKTNHGCGYNIVVTDKTKANQDEMLKKLNKWKEIDYSKYSYEMHYKLIEPQMYAEKFLDDITDIKVFCFNGIPKIYQIDRHLTHGYLNFYDTQWNALTWLSGIAYPANYSADEKPSAYLPMIYDYASKLAKPFKFVRVDFCLSNNTIYGGEMTFTPGAGFQQYKGDGDARLGNYLDL